MKLQIRNSTAEFLTFTEETGEKSIEVLYAEENVRATQEMMTILYDTTKQNISSHLVKAFASERRFYQKITDIYATAMEYNVNAPTTKEFLK